MGERDIIAKLARLFKKHKIAYLLTGSFAVSIWGRARSTHDIDFVIEVSPNLSESLVNLIQDLGNEFIVDLPQLKEAIREKSQFNVLHQETSLKIDFWISKLTDFEKSKFSRSVKIRLFGEQVSVISAEDLILTKLLWCRKIFSDRHFRDCVGICEVQGKTLNKKYLSLWAKALGVEDLNQKVWSGNYE